MRITFSKVTKESETLHTFSAYVDGISEIQFSLDPTAAMGEWYNYETEVILRNGQTFIFPEQDWSTRNVKKAQEYIRADLRSLIPKSENWE